MKRSVFVFEVVAVCLLSGPAMAVPPPAPSVYFLISNGSTPTDDWTDISLGLMDLAPQGGGGPLQIFNPWEGWSQGTWQVETDLGTMGCTWSSTVGQPPLTTRTDGYWFASWNLLVGWGREADGEEFWIWGWPLGPISP